MEGVSLTAIEKEVWQGGGKGEGTKMSVSLHVLTNCILMGSCARYDYLSSYH